MYTENYSPEEINRIKKIIEIGESQKQIKQSFWDEINTPDVLKLKEESNTLWEDYRIVDKKLLRKILVHNNGLSISDTKLNIVKTDDSTTNTFQDYDLLFENNLMNKICEIIGERELSELMSINGLLMDNFHEENKNIEAYIAKYTEAFATTIGVFANEGISELMKYVKENGIKLDLK